MSLPVPNLTGFKISVLFAARFTAILHFSMSRGRASLAMAEFLRLGRRALSRFVESTLDFTEHGFESLDSTVKIEEEHMPAYKKGLFCPVRVGQIFSGRYQILSKLGYGANSTVWFCHDLVYVCPSAE